MRGPPAALVVLALACGAAGCGGAAPSPARTPARTPPPPGAPLTQLAPAGADVVVELDIARLRDSEALGEAVAALRRGAENRGRSGLDLLAADELLLASYHVGRDSAQTITLVRGDRVGEIAGAEMVAQRTAAIGPPELLRVASETAEGAHDPVAADARIMELRRAAIPEAAPGAALRAGGELDFDARVGLSRLLSLRDVPVALAVWGDVVDDLAVVALLGAASAEEARSIAEAARAWRARAARASIIARYGLAPAVRGAEVTAEGATVRVTLVVPPARLARAASALARDAAALRGVRELGEDES